MRTQKLNYLVKTELLQFKPFQELKGTTRISALLICSAIHHYSETKGYLDLYKSEWCKDLGVKPKTITAAIEFLIQNQFIEEMRPYSRKGNLPARYTAQWEYLLNY